MGYALANEAAERGAKVILVSGPVSLKATHPNITTISVVSAQEMLSAADAAFPSCNVFISTAAVADYRPLLFSDKKIKKNYGNQQFALELTANPDILATLSAKKKQGQIVVGFALETDNALENAKIKLERKNLDMIVMNSLEDQGAGFQSDSNKVTMIVKTGEIKQSPLLSKSLIASMIIQTITRSFSLQSQNL
jgi:phosphopantothenoylcysteine decarboxylase/phosphopantothenate--cysteine ligase